MHAFMPFFGPAPPPTNQTRVRYLGGAGVGAWPRLDAEAPENGSETAPAVV
jgi:hypothetical protein